MGSQHLPDINVEITSIQFSTAIYPSYVMFTQSYLTPRFLDGSQRAGGTWPRGLSGVTEEPEVTDASPEIRNMRQIRNMWGSYPRRTEFEHLLIDILET